MNLQGKQVTVYTKRLQLVLEMGLLRVLDVDPSNTMNFNLLNLTSTYTELCGPH